MELRCAMQPCFGMQEKRSEYPTLTKVPFPMAGSSNNAGGFLINFGIPLHIKNGSSLVKQFNLFVKRLNKQLEGVYGKETEIYDIIF